MSGHLPAPLELGGGGLSVLEAQTASSASPFVQPPVAEAVAAARATSAESLKREAIDSFYHLAHCPLADRACCGTACFAARHENADRWAAAVAVEPRVYCAGRCYEAPALVDLRESRPSVRVCSREAVVLGRLAAGGARSLPAYRALGGYRALERATRHAPEETLRAVEASGLRGRGGAGFPTGRKWRAVARQGASTKFVVANADEGDPGAFLDRLLLEDDPHALLEGMLLAAYAVGARHGWIYLRREYPRAWAILRAAIAEAREAGLLGENAFGAGAPFDIEVAVGKGSYVCGEETALLRSLEGRRPDVAPRPPYPTERGLFGAPTLVNNVETLVSVPWIVSHGGEAYRSLGSGESRGTKVVSLNSLFVRPGLYEVEFGVTVRHLVEEFGGGLRDGRLTGVLIGGPLAGVIPPELLDVAFDFEALHGIGASVGHGGVVAFDERTSIPALVHHVFSLGAYESCGKCTPCRLGSRWVEALFRALAEGRRGRLRDREDWEHITAALGSSSLCGHGTGLAEFSASILRHYSKEITQCFE